MQIESFQQLPLQQIIPSYLYQEYANDETLQAFVTAQNGLTQGYLDWFNTIPLGVYASTVITGGLLDWIGAGIYNITRPVLSTSNANIIAGYNSTAYNTQAYDTGTKISGGTALIASDDIYKRVMTWNLYRGDGMVFTIGWLKNRIARFLYGANGTDYDVLNVQPSVTCSNGVFAISAFSSQIFSDLELAYNNNALSFPFQYSMTFNAVSFANDGGVLQMSEAISYPISATGLSAGSIWFNGGTIAVVPGVTPDPSAAPLYFSTTTPPQLIALGGGNLPITNPSNTGQLWNNSGVVSIS